MTSHSEDAVDALHDWPCSLRSRAAIGTAIARNPASREAAMIVLRRDPDGTPTVWCDPEIADLVDALNTGGLSTVASCSGHGHRPGRISLRDGRELFVVRGYDDAAAIDALFPVDINGEVRAVAQPTPSLSAQDANNERLRGSAFLLKVGNGADPAFYATIAGLRTTALSISDGTVVIAGAGVFTGSAAEARVKANALSGVLDDYRLSFESGDTMTGKFLVTRLDYAGDFNGERSFTLSLESSGEVVGIPPAALSPTSEKDIRNDG